MNEEQNKQYIENEIKSFESSCCPFGFLDIETAVITFIEVDLSSDDLFEAVEEFCESTETKFKDCDICYVAYDYILQEARNEIDNKIGFDICNDAEFYTAGNYIATFYDHSIGDQEELIKQLKTLTKEELISLYDNVFVNFFLESVDIYKDDIIN